MGGMEGAGQQGRGLVLSVVRYGDIELIEANGVLPKVFAAHGIGPVEAAAVRRIRRRMRKQGQKQDERRGQGQHFFLHVNDLLLFLSTQVLKVYRKIWQIATCFRSLPKTAEKEGKRGLLH